MLAACSGLLASIYDNLSGFESDTLPLGCTSITLTQYEAVHFYFCRLWLWL